MVSIDDVRAAALGLPGTSERPAPRGGHPQFVTNDKCFAESDDLANLNLWTADGWSAVDLEHATHQEIEGRLLAAWRLRAKKTTVAGFDYARGREELAGVFAELRSWPDLVERGTGDFHAGGRAFLHFHHYETSRHADVKAGLGWGDPIPFPLGPPPEDVTAAFYAEVRRRLEITLEAIAARKRR